MESNLDLSRFSYSKVSSYITCPRKFYLHYCLGLSPKRKSKALAVGAAMAIALSEYRKTGDPDDGIKGIISAWKSSEADCLDFSREIDPKRSVERLCDIFLNYCDHYPDEMKMMLQPEVTFQLPIKVYGKDIIFDGRIDGCILDGGSPSLIEDKTTSLLGDSFFREKGISFQILWYLYVAREMGFFSIKGKSSTPKCIINGIRIFEPPKKQTATPSFQREVTIKTNKTLDEGKESLIQWIETIYRSSEWGIWPSNNERCMDYGGCEFYPLKGIDEDSNMWNRIIAENFIVKEMKDGETEDAKKEISISC